MFISIRSKIFVVALLAFLAISCINQATFKEPAELNIGKATQKFKLDISGNGLRSYLKVKLLSDTSRNLIEQLGKYKFSTSKDPSHSEDNRYNPDAYIYYDYEGLQLKYVFKEGGSIERKDLQAKIEEFKKYVYLDRITFEPKKYKGSMPKNLFNYATIIDVERELGQHNTFFDVGSGTRKVSYEYPHHGMYFLFNLYSPAYAGDDSTILYLSLTDSVEEMKRYPTLYPKYSKR